MLIAVIMNIHEEEGRKKSMINFAVIGTNIITDRFLEAGSRIPGFCLKGVYSRSRERAEEYAGKHGAQLAFDSLEELAACGEIDAVYVASPNSLHARQSILMMEAGKHVLCEKTIASNSKEFAKMRETAEDNKVILLEAMRSVYSPGFAAIRESLDKIGPVRRASFQYCQYSRRYDNFKRGIIENAFRPELSNGALMDIGVYCIHPMAALFGMPERILSSCLKLSNGVDGAGTAILEYPGMIGEVVYSKITDSSVPSQIQGEGGTMIIDRIADPQAVEIIYRDGEKESLSIPHTGNNMIYETETFIKMINSGKQENPWSDASQIELQIMDEIRRQQGITFPADL